MTLSAWDELEAKVKLSHDEYNAYKNRSGPSEISMWGEFAMRLAHIEQEKS